MKTEVLNNFGTSENLNNNKKEFLSFDIPIALTQVLLGGPSADSPITR